MWRSPVFRLLYFQTFAVTPGFAFSYSIPYPQIIAKSSSPYSLKYKNKILPDTLKSYQTITSIEKSLINDPALISPCTHMQYNF